MRRVTGSDVRANALMAPAPASLAMTTCEFCASPMGAAGEPENVALLGHVAASAECGRQYEYLLDNLRASWTRNMSGG